MSSNEELERFRQEWLQEVRQQRAPPANAESSKESEPPSSPELAPQSKPSTSKTKTRPTRIAPARRSVDAGPSSVPSFPALELKSEKTQSALEIYKQAVDAEASGALDDALQLYRRAFRIDSNIDRIYERSLQREAAALNARHAAGPPPATATLPLNLETLSLSDKPVVSSHSDTKPAIVSIVEGFVGQDLNFQPEDEKRPTPIQLLPPELLVHVLHNFSYRCDYASIELFAAVSRKTRLLSLEPSLWREMVDQFYVPPQIDEDITFSDLVVSQYDHDYRRAFVEHPRIRFDGVYISVCHCERSGQSENLWVNVTHLITYHRYLRFFPDGTVLSLLANDENPSETVHILKPSLRRKGFYIGTWSLSGNTVTVRELLDPSGQLTKYGFEMILTIKSKPTGRLVYTSPALLFSFFPMSSLFTERGPSVFCIPRWNKLELEEYNSVKLETGEGDALPLRNERPFWFSKVRSYNTSPILMMDEVEADSQTLSGSSS
ncbi:hypothetical protein DL93DRAFT_2225638 [Clavulina sp. PMI_390]|nr:hypothetical protein DL93DRAFT_2225638 [Clavulina sp. PMI_390]